VEAFAQEDNPRLRLIGESGPGGDTGNRHEGYGGWSCARFATLWSEEGEWAEIEGRMRRQRSPFMFEVDGEPKLDFQKYLDKNNGGEPPDFITILLGCNDTFSATEETIEERIDSMFSNLDLLLTQFREAGPETQIGIALLVPPAASQDAFGRNYKCSQTRWQYRRNQHRVVEREMDEYGGGEEQKLFLIPAHVSLDTANGFPIRRAPAHVHATEEISRLDNGVHPSAAGYYQIGDSIYCWLKARLSAEGG
jgi:lysophospholipase L1-like esterase